MHILKTVDQYTTVRRFYSVLQSIGGDKLVTPVAQIAHADVKLCIAIRVTGTDASTRVTINY